MGPRASDPRTVILGFAAFDCAPCKAELADLMERRVELEVRDALYAVVVMDPEAERRDRMLEFLNDELRVPFPVVVDPPGQLLSRAYGVFSLPHTTVIEASGTIGWVSRGYRGPDSLKRLFEAARGRYPSVRR